MYIHIPTPIIPCHTEMPAETLAAMPPKRFELYLEKDHTALLTMLTVCIDTVLGWCIYVAQVLL